VDVLEERPPSNESLQRLQVQDGAGDDEHPKEERVGPVQGALHPIEAPEPGAAGAVDGRAGPAQ
jgi:hypothetical protein